MNNNNNDKRYVFERKIKKKITETYKWNWMKFSTCLFGVFLFSLGINLFIVPNNLYTGGVLGLAQLLRTSIISILNVNTNIDISSIIYYLINIPLLVIAYRRLSKEFFHRTLLTVSINSLLLAIIPIPNAPLMQNILANTLVGGILSGIGVGMVLSTGSSTGGIDIVGMLLCKTSSKITVGNIGLFFNTIVYGISGLIYGVEIMLYSIICSVFESIVTDINHMQNINSQTYIFTKKNPDEMIKYINDELHRGATYWKAVGGYTGTSTYIICTVVSKYERLILERHMKELDKDAFMTGNDKVMVKGAFDKYLV